MAWNHQPSLSIRHDDMAALASDPISEFLEHSDRIPLTSYGQSVHVTLPPLPSLPARPLPPVLHLPLPPRATNESPRECSLLLPVESVPGSSSPGVPGTRSQTLDPKESESLDIACEQYELKLGRFQLQ